MVRHTLTIKGFCEYSNEKFELEVPLFGDKPEMKCPLCKTVIFDIGGVIYHARQDD